MSLSKTKWLIFTTLALFINSSAAKDISIDNRDTYLISAAQNTPSELLAEYVFQQLSKRAKKPNLVKLEQKNYLKKTFSKHQIIYINVSEGLKQEYCIKRRQSVLELQLKQDGKNNQRIIAQLIQQIAHLDKRFTTADLPLPTLPFNDGCHNFDFTYREPFFAPNLIPRNAELFNTNSIDIDWGIWGHNLKKLLVNEKDSTLFALVNGKRKEQQLCFSSIGLFNNISNYILDNFGDGTEQGYQFMIAPQDNDLVCQDVACIDLGNTETNATPAVAHLLKKLADRFPKHQFFTIAYITTLSAPIEKLPDNAGVFLSTIDLPKGVKLNESQAKTQNFLKLLNEWKAKTSTIYLWDYASNFDDYLTPIPVLYGLQQQLQFYKAHDINGVFLNASGYDYSTFDGLKTYVSASLMIDSQQSIETLIHRYFKHYYPENHQLLIEYYLKLEHDFAKTSKAYPLYGGANEILQTYLNESDFVQFYNQLELAITKTKGTEKERLHKLFTALTFTRLQIAYQNGFNENGFVKKKGKTLTINPITKKWVSILAHHTSYKNLIHYRESSGDIANYIRQWENIISKKHFTNELLGIPITILSEPDEGFESSHLLNNGILGFAPDYHQGWYISSKDLKIGFSFPENNDKKEVHMRFLTDLSHGFQPPNKIEIIADGQIIKTISSETFKTEDHITHCSFSMDFKKKSQIAFYFHRKDGENSKIACDEIQIF